MARTVYRHLDRDRTAFPLGVRRFAEINGGVISVNWGEYQGRPDTGYLGHAWALRFPPENRSRWVSVGETSDFQLIAALLELAGWDAD